MMKVILAEVGLPDWWRDMTSEQQKEYLGEHPNSKFAGKVLTKPAAAVKDFIKFAKSAEAKPNSPTRRTAAKLFRDKAVGFVKNIKEEFVDEWKHFAHAAHAMSKGHDLSHHQKHAIRGLALKIITVGGPLLLSHPATSHLAHLLPEIAHHYVSDVMFTSIAKAVVFAAVVLASADAADKLADAIVKDFAEYLKSGDFQTIKNPVKS